VSDDLAVLDATDLAELVRAKHVSALELVEASIARIEKLNPQLNAVIHTAFAEARALAVRKDLPAGPFRGVPTLIKDTPGHQAGQPHHAGSRLLKAAGYIHPVNSYFVEHLLAAGLIPLGRTNVPEFALAVTTEPEAYGATHNPWNLAYSPGGSSGGSAAAVAAGLVPVAHASDGGGSIRGPASMCGLVGLKPTRGRSSYGPSNGEGWNGLACEFMLTRSVRDAAALLDVVAGAMPGDPYSALPPSRPFTLEVGASCEALRVGVLRRTLRDNVSLDSECLAAVDHTARVLADLGHHVEEAHPRALEEPHSNMVFAGIMVANLARLLNAWGEKLGKPVTATDVEPLTWALAEHGRKLDAAQFLGALEYMHGFGRRLASWFTEFDLLLSPTAAAPPPLLGTISSTPEEPLRAGLRAAPYSVFTYAWNLSGQPAISLPGHMTSSGLPIGVQLVAATAREDLLLRVASQLEVAAPWSQLRAAFASVEP
jgi:amidase